mmetsp:Transcript_2068/g.7172  ORF Transcript_2068/g.7172 Transcript_2068/m.7172 type:complete len:299 (+) Transcript_2068:192-1088(+)
MLGAPFVHRTATRASRAGSAWAACVLAAQVAIASACAHPGSSRQRAKASPILGKACRGAPRAAARSSACMRRAASPHRRALKVLAAAASSAPLHPRAMESTSATDATAVASPGSADESKWQATARSSPKERACGTARGCRWTARAARDMTASQSGARSTSQSKRCDVATASSITPAKTTAAAGSSEAAAARVEATSDVHGSNTPQEVRPSISAAAAARIASTTAAVVASTSGRKDPRSALHTHAVASEHVASTAGSGSPSPSASTVESADRHASRNARPQSGHNCCRKASPMPPSSLN